MSKRQVPKNPKYPDQVIFKVNQEVQDQLRVISDHHRRTTSDVLRLLILEEYQRIKSAAPATTPDEPETEWGIKD